MVLERLGFLSPGGTVGARGTPLRGDELCRIRTPFLHGSTHKVVVTPQAQPQDESAVDSGGVVEVEDPFKLLRQLRKSAILLVLHLLLGVAYCSTVFSWSLAESLYFCVVTITTVGYGDFVPTTPSSKIFFMVYILMSLTIVASAVNSVIGSILERQEEAVRHVIEDTVGERVRDAETAPLLFGFKAAEWVQILSALAVFLGLVITGTLFFTIAEKLDLIDAMYFIWVTCTTVGFGDLTPTKSPSRGFAAVFILLSTLSLANFLNTCVEVQLSRRSREARAKALQAKLDEKTFASIDANNDGKLSKDEYLVAMLRKLDLVKEDDLTAILDRFDELDASNDGFISEEEADICYK
ncbi:hypothetical protein NDN08_002624 [Rhodosorus marinus]|uniref:EF-hand domain-containing protein n=1 Tax=Rhodosorus marinus TaxID=101924 RepID=A0AAV8UU82_9RHOD|nr:hypothetical protein NDN08_002624 [Rhodosorus marinus]